MSLVNEIMDECVFLNKHVNKSGYGGTSVKWEEGAEFKAAIVFDTSIEARTAEAQGVSSRYTVSTSKSIMLEYHDVFRRVRDGKIFRVTSDGDDKYSPDSSTLDIRLVTAEEWKLTSRDDDKQ